MGIFEKIPEDTTPAKYAENLASDCHEFYGVARPQFIKQFVNMIAENGENVVKEQIETAMQEFYDKHEISNKNGYEQRIAKRFALAYAGGKLAIDYGILPFDEQSVMDGISKCYVDSMNSRPKSNDELAQEAFKIIGRELKKTKQFLDISQVNHDFSIEELKDAFGYLAKVNGERVKVIRSDALKSLMPNEKIMNMALDICIAKGRLLCDAEGKKTRQVKSNLKSAPNLPRAYCFLPTAHLNL
jgi:uncharacterized protein YxjI